MTTKSLARIRSEYRVSIIFCIIILVPAFAGWADNWNVEFVGQTPSFGTARAVYIANDYAYLCAGSNLVILDVSRPSAPEMDGWISTDASAFAVNVFGDYAYVATSANETWASSIRVIDISKPAKPQEVRSYDITDPANGFCVSGDYAYVTTYDAETLAARLRVIDISDLENFHEEGTCDIPDAWAIYVVGDYAYVAYDDGLGIIDISNPAAPQEVRFYDVLDGVYGWVRGIHVAGRYAYITNILGGLYIVDVSDPENPQKAGFYETSGNAHAVYVVGRYAYVADEGGLTVIDVSDPASPREKGGYDSTYSPYSVHIAGGYAYVTDMKGLRIIDVFDPINPYRTGMYSTLVPAVGGIASFHVAGGYAYFSDGEMPELQVIDVSDPEAPHVVEVSGLPVGDVGYVDEEYAFMTAGGDLQIMDVSIPGSPREVKSYDLPGYAFRIHVSGNYAYVMVSDYMTSTSSLRVIDISDPTDPREKGFYDALGDPLIGLHVADGYAYITVGDYASSRAAGLRVIDISDPTDPREKGSLETLGSGIGEVYVAGGYAYVTVSDYATSTGSLRVIDVSDPTDPREKGFYDTPVRISGLHVVGGYAYITVSDYATLNGVYQLISGLRIIDVANPANPRKVGFYDTPGWAGGVQVTEDYVYVGDSEAGLLILKHFASPARKGSLTIIVKTGGVDQNSSSLRLKLYKEDAQHNWSKSWWGLRGQNPVTFDDLEPGIYNVEAYDFNTDTPPSDGIFIGSVIDVVVSDPDLYPSVTLSTYDNATLKVYVKYDKAGNPPVENADVHILTQDGVDIRSDVTDASGLAPRPSTSSSGFWLWPTDTYSQFYYKIQVYQDGELKHEVPKFNLSTDKQGKVTEMEVIIPAPPTTCPRPGICYIEYDPLKPGEGSEIRIHFVFPEKDLEPWMKSLPTYPFSVNISSSQHSWKLDYEQSWSVPTTDQKHVFKAKVTPPRAYYGVSNLEFRFSIELIRPTGTSTYSREYRYKQSLIVDRPSLQEDGHWSQDDVQDLVDRYAPVLKMDSYELREKLVFPKEVKIAMDTAHLKDDDGEIIVKNGGVNSDLLHQFSGSDYYLDFLEDNPDDSLELWGNIQVPYHTAIYATAVREWEQIIIQYWIPYYYSNWKSHGGYNNHEWDWENITIILSGIKNPIPKYVIYSQHETWNSWVNGGIPEFAGGYKRHWDRVAKLTVHDGGLMELTDHPVVYVGRGGHASYFVRGEQEYIVPKVPLHETEYFNGYGNWVIPKKYCDSTKIAYQIDLLIPLKEVVLLPRASEVSRANDPCSWIIYSGHWGQKNLKGSLWGNNGPRGPAFTEDKWTEGLVDHGWRWIDPWGWANSKPADPLYYGPKGEHGAIVDSDLHARLLINGREVIGEITNISVPNDMVEFDISYSGDTMYGKNLRYCLDYNGNKQQGKITGSSWIHAKKKYKPNAEVTLMIWEQGDGQEWFASSSLSTRIDVNATDLITTIAGTGEAGFSGDSGQAVNARLNSPRGIFVDSAGNLFIADSGNHCIRRVDGQTGIITTVAGTGEMGFSGDDIEAKESRLSKPSDVFMDSAGNLFIADTGNNRIRMIDAQTDIMTTVVGTGEIGSPDPGSIATESRISFPCALFIDSEGDLFIVGYMNQVVYRVDGQTGIITDAIGENTETGFSCDAPSPNSIFVDSTGDLFVCDYKIWRIDNIAGTITTVAGGGKPGVDSNIATEVNLGCSGVFVDSGGDLFITAFHQNQILSVDSQTGIIHVVAGTGDEGFIDNVIATEAKFSYPSGIFIDSAGNLYISDTLNNRVRIVKGIAAPTTLEVGVFAYGADTNPWDIDSNNVVDISDLMLVADAFGDSGEGLLADVNGDGVVDIADLMIVATHFGEAANLSAPASLQSANSSHLDVLERWLREARAADDGSEIFRRGIGVLERLLNEIIPDKTALLHNYPNPFNPDTWIPYQLSEASNVSIMIHDTTGRVIKRFDLGYKLAGTYRTRANAAHWDGRNETGELVASGVYFVVLKARNYQETSRIVLLR